MQCVGGAAMTYSITPPPELVQQWRHQWWSVDPDCEGTDLQHYIATQSAQWGWEQRGAATEAELQQARDEELNACCEWLDFYSSATDARDLRLARRPPTPPSLKEQALDALATIEGDFNTVGDRAETIRRALEALPND